MENAAVAMWRPPRPGVGVRESFHFLFGSKKRAPMLVFWSVIYSTSEKTGVDLHSEMHLTAHNCGC